MSGQATVVARGTAKPSLPPAVKGEGTMTSLATRASVGTRTGGKFLTFVLGGEEYGLQILSVQEIIGMMDVTPIPWTSSDIRGVINLRGKIIPIVDLRTRFGMKSTERTAETCIIVVEANGVRSGIVADQVSEVSDIPGAEIEDPPSFGSEIHTDFILGIGKRDGKVRLLLDLDRVLRDGDLGGLAAVGRAAPEAAGMTAG